MIAIDEVVATVDPGERSAPAGRSEAPAPESRQTSERRLRAEIARMNRNRRRLAAT